MNRHISCVVLYSLFSWPGDCLLLSQGDFLMSIYVGTLAFLATDCDLRQFFAPYGAVGMIHITIDRYTGRSQGRGSVAMADRDAVQAAIAGLHSAVHAGRVLTVHAAPSGVPPCISSQSWW
jgi:RNA recognition motif-containing protein